MDEDHVILSRSDILGTLDKLSTCDDKDIKDTAEDLFEVLIMRCLGTYAVNSNEDSSPFIRRYLFHFTQC
jgi:hypothetical protein